MRQLNTQVNGFTTSHIEVYHSLINNKTKGKYRQHIQKPKIKGNFQRQKGKENQNENLLFY
jgi:hypothetical protein